MEYFNQKQRVAIDISHQSANAEVKDIDRRNSINIKDITPVQKYF